MILELQKKNLLKNLQPQDQQDGFLSIEYSADQLTRINHELGIFVAQDNDHLAGYLIAQTMDFALHSALIATMVKRFPDVQYSGSHYPVSRPSSMVQSALLRNQGDRGC